MFHSVPSPLGPLLRCPPQPVKESYDVSEEEATKFFGPGAPDKKKEKRKRQDRGELSVGRTMDFDFLGQKGSWNSKRASGDGLWNV